jgi:hypothetical protein
MLWHLAISSSTKSTTASPTNSKVVTVAEKEKNVRKEKKSTKALKKTIPQERGKNTAQNGLSKYMTASTTSRSTTKRHSTLSSFNSSRLSHLKEKNDRRPADSGPDNASVDLTKVQTMAERQQNTFRRTLRSNSTRP